MSMYWQRAPMGVHVTAEAPAAFFPAFERWNALDRVDQLAGRSPDVAIRLRPSDTLPGVEQFDHRLPTFGLRRTESAIELRSDGAFGRLDVRSNEIDVAALPGAEDEAVRGAARALLALHLDRIGRHRVHGSAVAVDGRGVLVSGASGSGKSTTGILLARQGHALIADDSVFVDRGGSLAGLRERPRVQPGGPAEPGPGGRRMGDGKVEPSGVEAVDVEVPAGLLVLMDEGVQEAGRVRPGDALERLTAGAFLPRGFDGGSSRLSTLRSLAATVPAIVYPARTCPSTAELVEWMEDRRGEQQRLA